MKRNEYEAKLKSLTEEIEKLKKVEIEEDEVWKPEINENYYLVSGNGTIKKAKWIPCGLDVFRFDNGNVFKTEEEAEFEAERMNVYRKLRQYSSNRKLCKDYFYIGYDIFKKGIVYVKVSNSIIRYGDLCFESKEVAEKAVEFVGKEKVLKYYLEIEEQ